jgi:TolB protein
VKRYEVEDSQKIRNKGESVHTRLARFGFLFAIFLVISTPAFAQDWFRISTGLGVEKPRVAVADFSGREDASKAHSKLFTEVVRDDLGFSGILELASPSFYPQQQPSIPSELRYTNWTDSPVNAHFVAFGNLTESASEVAIQAWFYDVTNPSTQAVISKIYRGAPNDPQVRKFAHQFADEIIGRLSGGLPSVASTQIAFVSSRSGAKEIWVMDYDGANQHALTSLRSISLTPRWSPDASRIAFTCFAYASGVTGPQICMYSLDAGKTIAFPLYK